MVPSAGLSDLLYLSIGSVYKSYLLQAHIFFSQYFRGKFHNDFCIEQINVDPRVIAYMKVYVLTGALIKK